MMTKPRLMTPGPSPVPEDVLLELARPIFHHRTDRFRSLMADVVAGLKQVFMTEHDVLVFASSGTGAMEASVVNAIPPGGKAIVTEAGKFGERWGDLCRAFGVEPIVLSKPWGEWFGADDIAAALKEHPDAAAVLTTLSETSSGVAHDIEGIGRVVAETDALLIVDGISGVGAVELRADAWGVDCLAVGSQKALMLPPGLGMLSVSPKAWARIEANEAPRTFYFDLLKARKSSADFDTPYTPAHTLVLALKKALDRILEEGVEAVWQRHRVLSEATRAGCRAMGLELLAKRPADGLTTVCVPEGVDGSQLTKELEARYGVKVAGGQSHLKGKIFRIAHMGHMDIFDCLAGLAAVELTLAEMGYPVEFGRAVGAAQKVYAAAEKQA